MYTYLTNLSNYYEFHLETNVFAIPSTILKRNVFSLSPSSPKRIVSTSDDFSNAGIDVKALQPILDKRPFSHFASYISAQKFS